MKNEANIRIYGDLETIVAVGDPGITLPIDLSPLPTTLDDMGWLSEDGADVSREISSTDFTAYQGGTIVRQKITSTKNTVKVTALEETVTSLGLFYPGMIASTTGEVTRIKIPGGTKSNVRSMVVDFFDDNIQKRYCIPRCEVSGLETIPHKNTDLTMYGYTFTIYGDFEIITNNPALAVTEPAG